MISEDWRGTCGFPTILASSFCGQGSQEIVFLSDIVKGLTSQQVLQDKYILSA